jgi:hypothetical protein
MGILGRTRVIISRILKPHFEWVTKRGRPRVPEDFNSQEYVNQLRRMGTNARNPGVQRKLMLGNKEHGQPD